MKKFLLAVITALVLVTALALPVLAAEIVRPAPYIQNGTIYVPDWVIKAIAGSGEVYLPWGSPNSMGDQANYGNGWLTQSPTAEDLAAVKFTRAGDWWTVPVPGAAMANRGIRFCPARKTGSGWAFPPLDQWHNLPWVLSGPGAGDIAIYLPF